MEVVIKFAFYVFCEGWGGGGVPPRGLNFDSIFFRYLKKCLIESELLSMKNFEVF